MIKKTITNPDGRNYEAWVDGNLTVIIGPPEGLVDELGLPEPFATRLHNVLHSRGFLSYETLNSKGLIAALQEALIIDAQRLNEAYFRFYQEVHHDDK